MNRVRAIVDERPDSFIVRDAKTQALSVKK